MTPSEDDGNPAQAGYAEEEPDSEHTRAWWDAVLDASGWFGLKIVSPKEAAMLMCGLNPNDPTADGTMLADGNRPNADGYRSILRQFEDAATDGTKRTLRRWLEVSDDRDIRRHSWIDEWLAASRDDSWPAQGDAQPAYAVGELAAPQELIAAFGSFTGMDALWFNSLKDTPALRDARKQRGRGGRACRAVEPLFCPYEVMKWLIDPKRKKGRQLREETGWRLLKGHFPASYKRFQEFEPPDDDT